MDSRSASKYASQARRGCRDASRPQLPLALCGTSSPCAGVGVALVGQSSQEAWVHLTVLAAGLLLLAAAYLVPAAHRRRRGLHGHRGPVEAENATFLACGVALTVTGMGATHTLSTIYIGLGVVTAVAYFLVLRGKLIACRP